jgi:hypothetical protein
MLVASDTLEELMQQVEACTAAIADMLPQLRAAHSPLAVAIALALHMSAAREFAIKAAHESPGNVAWLFDQLASLDIDPDLLDH